MMCCLLCNQNEDTPKVIRTFHLLKKKNVSNESIDELSTPDSINVLSSADSISEPSIADIM